MIKAFLFDFFDVVRADSFHAWMRNHGYTRDDAPGEVSQRMDEGKIGIQQFFAELAEISGQTKQEVIEEMDEAKTLNTEVVEYIEELKNSFTVAMISNADATFLREELNVRGLDGLFHYEFISSELGVAKPDKEIFEVVLRKLSLNPDEVIFIDDQQKNVDAAKDLGIKGIVFSGSARLLEDEVSRMLND